MFDMFRSERKKWRTRAEDIQFQSHVSLPNLDGATHELFGKALPRGVLLPRLEADRARVNYWMSPIELMRYRFEPGHIILGKFGHQYLGHLDDRPMVTIAGARAGKTSTVLEPNLYLYSGSALVLDPKGELARSAPFRRAMGHDVYVLDPFGQSGEPTACYNPLDELDPDSPTIIDDVASITNALVIDDGDSRSQHWRESARKLLTGIILLTLSLEERERNLVTVRELLCLTYKPLALAAKAAAAKALAEASPEEKHNYFDANKLALKTLLHRMEALGDRFGGIAAAEGTRLLNTPQTERGSIFSTAATQTDFLDSLMLRRTLKRSDFRLATLRGDRPATIFLCLPVGRMEQHSRWLRLVVQLACVELEALGAYPRDRPPILFMMEEFATLGHMEIMERAAAYFPGFGVKLWVVLQDVTQLKRHYKNGWETFLGNAGLVQLFANGDEETLRYAAGRMEKLIAPFELRTAFSRQRHSQLLLMEGMPPAAAVRLEHSDVARIRDCANLALLQDPVGPLALRERM
ncbi:type IV secretory system conjugative DNA transfer family protein [Bradyrhizobium sp. CCGUVB4N]|uniref:type IV secretory system conjugative DNA transfer family protein n=1 Tax=Bradyrhizobium sp. CCGUVB4N TaxID=2949631 RepID=UPI0020B29DD7|nr:type IV secretory system conjugative DNA transfer family protein [Bradyrhizobium sp. CCGUVB4N]MCP3381253.1 type IV secretory system conjugative DNA transfer family protein [Bradyrhizobium sp. CCGUVB4N]